jgi:hypothetical protein
MTPWEKTVSKWQAAKPAAIALTIGLVAGPLISNYVGWQVTSRTARAEIHAGLVEQQAMFCEARARADVSAPGELNWTARYELAVKWAPMPGAGPVDADVTSACARKLAV